MIFVKENLSNNGPVVTTIANVFCLSLDVPQGGNRLQSYSINNITTSADKYGFQDQTQVLLKDHYISPLKL